MEELLSIVEPKEYLM